MKGATRKSNTILKSWWIVLASVGALVYPVVADERSERATLAGLTGVRVEVEDIAADAEREGLTESDLQRDIEMKLQQAGIRVFTEAEWRTAPGKPTLNLEVRTLKPDTKTYVVSITLELEQEVRLARDATVNVSATTWSAPPRLGIVAAGHFSSIRRDVREIVDQFIQAYLAANPKR